MATKRERVLQALFEALGGIAPGWVPAGAVAVLDFENDAYWAGNALRPTLQRNGNLPQRIPADGLLMLRDGDPGEPEVLLSPPEYVYEHRAEIDVLVEAPTPEDRAAIFDGLMLAIGLVVAADRTLGGLCDYVETAAPDPVDLIIEGAPGLEAATLPIILHYGTPDPLS